MTAPAIAQPRERPILFSGEMVRAILDGRKTQTRRVVKFRPGHEPGGPLCRQGGTMTNGFITRTQDRLGPCMYHGGWSWQTESGWCDCIPATYAPPAGAGDVLWVRESWCALDAVYNGVELDTPRCIGFVADGSAVSFRDDLTRYQPDMYGWEDWPTRGIKRKPSIFLPKWASRIWLQVEDVRVERVGDISDEDAKAEGAMAWAKATGLESELREERLTLPQLAFSRLWDSINKARGYGWDVNPWVWAITYRVLSTTGRVTG